MHFSKPATNIFAQQQTKEQLDRLATYSGLIQKVVNLGTHVLDCIRESTHKKINNEKKAVVIAFFRRIVELLDSIAVQLQAGCVVPSLNNLRVLLEAFLQLEYFLKDADQIPLKYKQYVLMDIDGRIALFSKMKDNTEAPEQLLIIDGYLNELQKKLDLPFFDELRPEYIKMVFKTNGERRNSTPKWYSLNKDLENVWKLAVNLHREEEYNRVYTTASEVTHSSGLMMDGFREEGDQSHIVKIRDARYTHGISRATFLIGYQALELVGKQLGRDDRFKYQRERDQFRRANRKEILTIIEQNPEVIPYSD